MTDMPAGTPPSRLRDRLRRQPEDAPHDHFLLLLLAVSLVAHLGVILPMVLLNRDRVPKAPTAIPVELVREPNPAEANAAEAARQAAAERDRQDQAKQEQAKQEQARQEQARQEQAKQEQQAKQQATSKEEPSKQADAASQEGGSQRLQQLLGPSAAYPLPGAAADGTELVSYKQLVLSQVAKAKKEGRYTGVPGVAAVRFTLGDNGEVVSCDVVRKSVDPSLDAEAVDMVRRGAPYPAPPPGAKRDFVVGLRFQAAN